VLAALPALAAALPAWVDGRVEPPFAVQEPGVDSPAADTPGPSGTRATPATDPGSGPAAEQEEADPPAGDPGDDGDQDDDSSGPGGSGGGGSGGGGSSGPG
jgi:hypothetical protein